MSNNRDSNSIDPHNSDLNNGDLNNSEPSEHKPSIGGFVNKLAYPQPFRNYVVELCQSASRYINILSPTLDYAVFDNDELGEILSSLVRRSRQTRVRILIADSREIVHRGHRLLTLARRLPSKVLMQKLSEHPDWNGETVITRDHDGVLYKPEGSDHDAFFEPDSRASTQRHVDRFNTLWEVSVSDPELRTIHI